MKTKIMIILPNLVGGGAERVSINIANHLNLNRYDVVLVSCGLENDYANFVKKEINIIRLQQTSMKKATIPLSRVIKQEQPTIIVAAMAHVFLWCYAAMKLAKHSSKIIFVEHNTYSYALANSSTKVKTYLNHLVLKVSKLYQKSDQIVFVSHEAAQDFQRIFPLTKEQWSVIYNPVIFPELDIRMNEPVAFEPNYQYILAVGRLTKQKDYPTFIEAIHYLVKEKGMTHVRGIIVGKGELEEALKKEVQRRKLEKAIIFWGFEENPYKLMKQCDAFVLSSLYEGLPTVLIEAMYCGAAVVSTKCPSGPQEIIQDGLNGYLVPVGDSVLLAEQIYKVLKDAKRRNGLKGEARKRGQDFLVENSVREYEQLFDSLTNKEHKQSLCVQESLF